MLQNSRLQNFIYKIQQGISHFPEYKAALIWVLRDVFLGFPWTMIKLLAFSMLGASLQGAVLMGAIQYVHSLEKGSALNIKGISIATHGGDNLSLAVLAFFLLLCLSAWILYLGKAVGAKLVSDYQAYMLKRALALFGTVVPGQPAPEKPSEAQKSILQAVFQDAQKSVMLVRFLGNTLPNLVVVVYAFPILVYLDFSMTLLLLCLVVFFLPFFYQDNLMSYESNLMAKRSAAGAKNTLSSLMEDIKDYQYISPKQTRAINKAFRRGELKDRISFLSVFLRSMARTELWTNILLSFAVCLVLMLQVPKAMAGEASWSLLLGYLMFLRLGVNAFKSFMTFLTKFSRFYPYISRYQNFVQSAEMKPGKNARLVIRAAAHGISETDRELQVQAPLLLALITRVPLSRYTFPYMVKLGSKADNGILASPRECFFIGPQGLPQKDGSLQEMLGLPEGFTPQDLEQAMPEDLLSEIKRHLSLKPDTYHGPGKWNRLCMAHRVELGIVSALLSPARIVALEKFTLEQLPRDRLESFLGQLAQQKELTIISYPEDTLHSAQAGHSFREQLCAVSGCSSNLLALGSPEWIRDNKEKIQELLAEETVRLKQGGGGVDTAEEMDEDD